MKSDGPLQLVGARWSESDACGVELCGDEMACDGLSGFGEGGVAIVTEELSCGFVGTSDFEQTAGELENYKVVEPSTSVGGVESLD